LNRIFPASVSFNSQVESRLFTVAGWFLFFYSLAISLSPAARFHSWVVTYRWEQWIGFIVWLVGSSIVFRKLNKSLPDRDPYIFPLVMVLVGWGLLEVWRLSSDFGLRQTIWMAISLTLLFFLSGKTAYLDLLRRYKYLWLASGLALTALTFVIGTYPGGDGPHLWLDFFGVYLQPTEPLKILLIVYLSAYLADLRMQRLGLLQWLMPAFIILAAALVILFAQRDLGTGTLFILLFTFVVYFATGRRRLLIISLAIIIGASFLGYQLFDVIRVRVDAWINPWLDSSGRSYQIVQSIIAIASGGVFGRGPGLGSPGIIPVAQSDFIFSAIAEETGLFGIIGLITVIGLLFSRGLAAAVHSNDTYRRNLAAGISIYLVIQSIFIIGGNIRLLPLSGVTLPFVSYGGSSLLTGFISIWMLLTISQQSSRQMVTSIRVEPYQITGALILTGLAGAALTSGWWSVIRSSDLSDRVDNPRRVIAERYVLRGTLVDRTSQPINQSVGTSGNYIRNYYVPSLAATTGYSHPVYGLGGLEQAYDDYLRGVKGNPSLLIWSNQMLYGQPPPGLDVRLSIDLEMQAKLDKALQGNIGAAILMNAETGEILAISSQPGFDPNSLDKTWLEWSTRSDSPLLNRVTQGVYPAGTAITPFILASQTDTVILTKKPARTNLVGFDCSLNPGYDPDWNQALIAGCPGSVLDLLDRIPINQLEEIYRSAGFFDQPELNIPQTLASPLRDLDPEKTITGNENVYVTPLQMVIAASSISANGVRPAPRIAIAVNTPAQGWVILPAGQKNQVFISGGISNAINLLNDGESPFWHTTASVPTKEGLTHWFVSGTLPDWQGTPLALAVVLEGNTANMVSSIGKDLFHSVLQK
jgi:cell division protein FtsW (lipid II flippase)